MLLRQKLTGIVLGAVLSSTVLGASSDMVYQPASIFNGGVYAEINGAYSFEMLKLGNDQYTGMSINHGNQKLQNFVLGAELGYVFDRNYVAPIRLGLDLLYWPSKKFTNNPVTPGSASFASGKLSTTAILGNVYYDFYTDSEMTPYVGIGLGMASNSTQYNIINITTNNVTVGSNNQTSRRLAMDALAGVAMSFTKQFDGDLFVRLTSLGSAPFTSASGTGAVSTTAHRIYTADIGLGVRYHFN